MPLPGSPAMGLGMNEAYTPCFSAISFTTSLYVITASAMDSASAKRRSISCCEGPFSWWLYSTGMPIFSSVSTVSRRRSEA